MKTTLFFLALCVIAASFASNVAAQDSRPADQPARANEVETLKRRVEELEGQNRAMMQLLVELKNKLDQLARSTHPAAPATAQPVNASASLPGSEASRMRGTSKDRLSASRQPDAANFEKPSAVAVSKPAEPESAQSSGQAKPAGGEPLQWSDFMGKGNKIKLYGFLRLDMDIDSQRPNNAQIPFFITSGDSRIGKADAGSFSVHPRLTRLGIDYSGPEIAALNDAKLAGKFEVDFENGGTESRQIIRIRHAYFKLDWGQFSLLGGQTWDVVSPLFPTVNYDSLMWNAGNVGDRRPQFRFASHGEGVGG